MPRFTRPLRIGGSFTASNLGLPPHFFLGHPAKGFPGIGFLEVGLQAGVDYARSLLTEYFDAEITALVASSIKGIPSVTAPRAGIKLSVINNVPALNGININTLLGRAFSTSSEVAKVTADSFFEGNKASSDEPLTNSEEFRPTVELFDYQAFSSGSGVGLRVRFLGSNEEIGKTFALNYGLRSAAAGEAPLGFTK